MFLPTIGFTPFFDYQGTQGYVSVVHDTMLRSFSHVGVQITPNGQHEYKFTITLTRSSFDTDPLGFDLRDIAYKRLPILFSPIVQDQISLVAKGYVFGFDYNALQFRYYDTAMHTSNIARERNHVIEISGCDILPYREIRPPFELDPRVLQRYPNGIGEQGEDD